MGNTILSYQTVSVYYGGIQALDQVSLEINKHEVVALIGANGAGKTTLMMSLFGKPRIRSGQILYQQMPIQNLPTHEIHKLGISISPEGRRVFPKMTIEENLILGSLEQSQQEQRVNCAKMYGLFPVLGERKKQRAGTLSGGEQQMLAIARALMSNPTLFLLDEPSLGLAPQMVQHIFNTLKQIASDGTTVFLVEQNAHMALKISDRGYVLVNGRIELAGKAQELLDNPQIQAAYLGTI